MGRLFGGIVAGSIDLAVRRVVVPVTSAIPVLVERGALLALFAALWAAGAVALATNAAMLDTWWRAIGDLPLAVQGLVWLLFLPLMAGLWTWHTDWPLVVRVGVIVVIAAWNLLVFVPRRHPGSEARVNA